MSYTKGHVHLGVIAAGERDECEHEIRLLGIREIHCDHCDIEAAIARVSPLIARRGAIVALRDAADAIDAMGPAFHVFGGHPQPHSVGPGWLRARAEEMESE